MGDRALVLAEAPALTSSVAASVVGVPAGPSSTAGLPVALVLALAAMVELVLQALRAFFPLGYHLVGTLGFIVPPVILTGVFVSPLLVPVIARLLRGWTVVVLAAGLGLARLVLQVEPSLAVAVVAVVAGLLAVTAALPVVAGHRYGPDAVAAGTLVGFGLDVALRAWRATDDVVWSSGVSAWLDPSLVVPVVLLAATVSALGPAASRTRTRPPGWTWAVLLMPQLLLWTSLAFVGSSGEVSLAAASITLVGATALAMVLLAWPRARLPWQASAAVVLAVALAMPWSTGWPVLGLAVAGTAVTPLLVREAAAHAAGGQFRALPQAAGMAGGLSVMFVLLLLYPLHYEIPLPIDNRWLPGIAVVLACLPLTRRGRPSVREFATPSRIHRPAVALVAAGAVGLGAAVHAGVVGGSPRPGPDPRYSAGDPSAGEVRVATYNTGQGQRAETGDLSFADVTDVIVGLDADVVVLQEVARGWPLTSMSDYAAWLRTNTDLEIVVAPAADRQFGNALVARVPVRDVTTLPLAKGGGAQQRSAIRARLDDGTTVYGMHLQARNTAAAEQSRLDQMQQVLDDWAGRPRTVLAGDLNPRNEYPDETETPPTVISNLEPVLDAGFTTTQPTRRCTQPTSGDNCSDYVFTTPDVRLTRPHEVVPVDVTDHRPVRAHLAP